MSRIAGIFLFIIGAMFVLVGILGVVISLMNAVKGKEALAFVFGGLIFVGIIMLAVGRSIFKKGEPIGIVPKPVEGRVGNFLANAPETREKDGREYEVHYVTPVSGKNGRPSSLHVRVPCATPTTMQFHQENWFDRFSKSIGIAREYQSGDEEFDTEVYVRCPSEAYAELYLADADRRSAVLAIRKLGFKTVELTGSQVMAFWPGFDPAKHDHPELVSAASDLLAVLAKDVPTEDPDNAAERGDRTKGLLAFLWVIAIGYACTLFSLIAFTPVHASDLLLTAAPVFIGGYVFFGWIAAFLIGGTSNAHDRWGTLMVVGFVLHGLGSVGITAGINGLMDPGPAVEREQLIINKRTHTSSGKNKKTTYHAEIQSWIPGGDSMEFSVSSSEYHRITTGKSKLHLTTSPGKLGIEWYQGKRVIP